MLQLLQEMVIFEIVELFKFGNFEFVLVFHVLKNKLADLISLL